MTGAQQRAALQRKIWDIANDVRGAVDGWDFKQYVLGTLFYRFISENFALYIEADDESIRYAELDDSVITPEIKDDAIKTKGYFVYPSQLFTNITENVNTNENLNTDLAATLQSITLPADRKIQDYRSTYNDIRDWLRREKAGNEKEESTIDWNDVVFEVDLLKSQEINLDYILELIFEHNKKTKDKANLVEEVRRLIRGSVGNRAKESLVVDFINHANLDELPDKASVIEAFFCFARAEQQREAGELIADENLNLEAAKRYISTSLKREFASENGTELNAILPKMSPLNPQYLTKKQSVFQKIAAFVEKFKGVGGDV